MKLNYNFQRVGKFLQKFSSTGQGVDATCQNKFQVKIF